MTVYSELQLSRKILSVHYEFILISNVSGVSNVWYQFQIKETKLKESITSEIKLQLHSNKKKSIT